MAKNLEGKAALVTGGSRGIGAAIAKRLAREGASVAITYASSQGAAEAVVGEIERSGGRALAIRADSADAAAVQAAVARTAETFGRLDVLVNNAGVAIFQPLEAWSVEAFDHTYAVNVRAVFAAIQAAVEHMGEGGSIITIGSVNGDRIPMPTGAVYAMSKAAVAGLTRGLARDLGPRGVTVNTVQPGPIDTELNPSDGPMAPMMHAQTALNRHGTVEEVAGLVAYLAGPEARYVTGASLNVDGGFNA